MSGANIMAQKQKIGKHLSPTNAEPGYIIPMAITAHHSPADWARELFKPSKDGKSLVVGTKKNCFSFEYRFFSSVSGS